ncbi:MAG: 2-phospho-L-lactate transferase [Roseomonas sp.]|nr:2-phospho-L-lactate transferase [Roseomonas sp.]MCA3282072.1 2-phospho-L-lactate transferase [Roseomonas sp.]MCA3298178.1 2-phospho-L-lactate transferase [Roseomonas sp.]
MIIALSGGIGGAKMALGLSHVLPPEELLIIANTGDDFEHYGLTICPDTDTLLYTLAGLDNPQLGWGRADESWAFMETLASLGGADWFRLGDRDLALHVLRNHRLRAGESLSTITDDFRQRFGIGPRILPMSDDPVRTQIGTDQGWLDFQDWFVRLRAEPLARAVKFAGVEQARPQPVLLEALRAPPRGIVICPSNPFISIEPILAVPGLRDAIAASGAPVVAVSPIIAGQAVKGPTARMFEALGVMPSAAAVAARYGDLLDGYVMEHGDDAAGITPRVFHATTLMRDLADKTALARQVLAAIEALR